MSASLTDEDAHTQGRLAARRINVTTNYAPNSRSTSTLTSAPAPVPPPLLGKRKSFVGTPCWMAPEVISQKQYDSSADIWSLGITALELAQGRAPHSRDPPARALAKILNNDPPTLDRAGGVHRYSRAFADVVAQCLSKEPSARPTAAQLLAFPFFRAAPTRPRRHLVRTLLVGLPPLASRQERRRQSSIASHPSASSWDFSTTYTHIRRSSASVSVHCASSSPAPSPHRSRSHASVESNPGTGSLHFRTNSLKMRNLSIGGECEEQECHEACEEGGHALVLKGRRDRDRERTRGREEAVTPLLVSDAAAAQPHVPEPDTLDLDSASSDDEEEEEANGRHLDVDPHIKNSSAAGSGSGSGSAAGSTRLDPSPLPSPLAPPSSASLSSASSPEDLATPPTGTTPIKVWRRLRGKVKMRKEPSSSVGTSRLSGLIGAVLERKMSRK